MRRTIHALLVLLLMLIGTSAGGQEAGEPDDPATAEVLWAALSPSQVSPESQSTVAAMVRFAGERAIRSVWACVVVGEQCRAAGEMVLVDDLHEGEPGYRTEMTVMAGLPEGRHLLRVDVVHEDGESQTFTGDTLHDVALTVTEDPLLDPTDGVVVDLDVDDPVAFAIAMSQERFPVDRTATRVVLASANGFADALAGAALTADGPLLLVDDGGDTAAVQAEVDRVLLDTGLVYILGGDAAVAWEPLGRSAIRLSGPSRIETAAEVADHLTRDSPPAEEVLLARAHGVEGNPTAAFADSITAGAYAAATGRPLVLTTGDALHPAAHRALAEARTPQTTVLGGTAAVSDAVLAEVPGGTRVAGPSRESTALAIHDDLWGDDASGHLIVIDGFSDDGWIPGLVLAGLAADLDAPMLLTHADGLGTLTEQAITEATGHVWLAGDFTAAERSRLSQQVEEAIAAR